MNLMSLDPLWEYGGDFPWPDSAQIMPLPIPEETTSFFSEGVLFGTGRAAIVALLEHGRRTRAWRRLWVPSYFCPRVIQTIEAAGWDCPRYSDTPLSSPYGRPPEIAPGDVVLRMNFFGWRGAEAIAGSPALECDVIEDHSHDPYGAWARGSRASFCIVSLRKTIPIPDGGWLWSPQQHELPAPGGPSEEHMVAAGMKISGMLLKQHYRAGFPVPKSNFRECLLEGEALLGNGPPGGIHPVSKSLLKPSLFLNLAEKRRKNFQALCSQLPRLSAFSPVLELPENCSPFALVLHFASLAQRERVREQLIHNRIYPSVLWSLPHAEDPAAVDFGNRSLTIPCHYQYSEGDLARMARTLEGLFAQAAPSTPASI